VPSAADLLSEDVVRTVVIPAVARLASQWRLVIPGEPVAKGRPKLGVVNGHAHAFTPKRTRSYEDIVRQTAIREWNRPLLADVPITMDVAVFRGIPKSWSKRNREAALLGELRPLGRPDWDNFGKLAADALNGVVYLDDGLIVDARVQKFYAIEPRVEIALRWSPPA
jgi:Holliday junction resolvase RusA-like endonuclease